MYPQGEMMMQDKLEKERCDAKNAVEEYVYEMRDKIANVLAQFIKEEVRYPHTRTCYLMGKGGGTLYTCNFMRKKINCIIFSLSFNFKLMVLFVVHVYIKK